MSTVADNILGAPPGISPKPSQSPLRAPSPSSGAPHAAGAQPATAPDFKAAKAALGFWWVGPVSYTHLTLPTTPYV